MFEKLLVPKVQIDMFVDSYKVLYRKINHQYTKLLPNALQSLKLASSFATLGIVTTKTTKYTTPMLEHFDILSYFDVVIGRQEVINPKPHPEPILKALQSLNPKPNSSIYMIGDTILDMQSAKDAQVCGVGVLCGYGSFELLSKYSQIVTQDSLQAVQTILNQTTTSKI
jgi:phosphoglycolate phosphatase